MNPASGKRREGNDANVKEASVNRRDDEQDGSEGAVEIEIDEVDGVEDRTLADQPERTGGRDVRLKRTDPRQHRRRGLRPLHVATDTDPETTFRGLPEVDYGGDTIRREGPKQRRPSI